MDQLRASDSVAAGVSQSPRAVEIVSVRADLIEFHFIEADLNAGAVVIAAHWGRRGRRAVVSGRGGNVSENGRSLVIDVNGVSERGSQTADISSGVDTGEDQRAGAVVAQLLIGDGYDIAAVVKGLQSDWVRGRAHEALVRGEGSGEVRRHCVANKDSLSLTNAVTAVVAGGPGTEESVVIRARAVDACLHGAGDDRLGVTEIGGSDYRRGRRDALGSSVGGNEVESGGDGVDDSDVEGRGGGVATDINRDNRGGQNVRLRTVARDLSGLRGRRDWDADTGSIGGGRHADVTALLSAALDDGDDRGEIVQDIDSLNELSSVSARIDSDPSTDDTEENVIDTSAVDGGLSVGDRDFRAVVGDAYIRRERNVVARHVDGGGRGLAEDRRSAVDNMNGLVDRSAVAALVSRAPSANDSVLVEAAAVDALIRQLSNSD